MQKKPLIKPLLFFMCCLYILSNVLHNNRHIKTENYYIMRKNKAAHEYLSLEKIRASKDTVMKKLEEGKFDKLYTDQQVQVALSEENEVVTLHEWQNYEPYKGIMDPMELLKEEIKVIEFFLGDISLLDQEQLIDGSTTTVEEDGYHFKTYAEVKKEIEEGNYHANREISRYDLPAIAYAPVWDSDSDFRYIYVQKDFGYIAVMKGKLIAETKGKAEFYEDPEVGFEPIASYFRNSDQTEDKYELFDGNAISVKDAIAYVEDFMNNKLPYEKASDALIEVAKVDVFEVAEGKRCFEFSIRRKYSGLVFEYGPVNSSGAEMLNYPWDSGKVIMTNVNDIDEILGTNFGIHIEQENTAMKEIISMESAIQILSEKAGQNSRYCVESIEMAYRQVVTDRIDNSYLVKMDCVPVWKILCRNDNDQKETVFYVDMKTGQLTYRYL